MDKRPALNNEISLKDFQEFYWLKEELIQFCRTEGLTRTGSKIELANRIETFLVTGSKEVKTEKKTPPKSRFDWKSEPLHLSTVITDNYKNTENVRAFFQEHLGEQFKFNVQFMDWMKGHVGSKLSDAIAAWKAIKIKSKTGKGTKSIAPQFEYNQYIRDFMKDNSEMGRDTAIAIWKIKRSMRGDNVYDPKDISLLGKL